MCRLVKISTHMHTQICCDDFKELAYTLKLDIQMPDNAGIVAALEQELNEWFIIIIDKCVDVLFTLN
jgi:hypothetical protein